VASLNPGYLYLALHANLFQEGGTPLAKPFLLAVWFGTAAVIALAVPALALMNLP